MADHDEMDSHGQRIDRERDRATLDPFNKEVTDQRAVRGESGKVQPVDRISLASVDSVAPLVMADGFIAIGSNGDFHRYTP